MSKRITSHDKLPSGVYLLNPHQLPAGVDVICLDQDGYITKNSILASIATAFSFPEYFGYNWDAAYDCLLDRFEQPGQNFDVYFTATAATVVDEAALLTFRSLLDDLCDEVGQYKPLRFYIIGGF